MAEGTASVRSIVHSSTGFLDPAFDVFIVEDEAVEEESVLDLGDLTAKDDRGPSTSLQIQKHCRTCGLLILSDDLSV